MTKNKEICKSEDCLIEIIEFHDSGHPTGGVSLPTPGIQSCSQEWILEFMTRSIKYVRSRNRISREMENLG